MSTAVQKFLEREGFESLAVAAASGLYQQFALIGTVLYRGEPDHELVHSSSALSDLEDTARGWIEDWGGAEDYEVEFDGAIDLESGKVYDIRIGLLPVKFVERAD